MNFRMSQFLSKYYGNPTIGERTWTDRWLDIPDALLTSSQQAYENMGAIS
jgi:hypothetical protein